jgi:hypothetical protein
MIVEAAKRNCAASFAIDDEAVRIGINGVSDFNGLHSRRQDAEVQLRSRSCKRSRSLGRPGRAAIAPEGPLASQAASSCAKRKPVAFAEHVPPIIKGEDQF